MKVTMCPFGGSVLKRLEESSFCLLEHSLLKPELPYEKSEYPGKAKWRGYESMEIRGGRGSQSPNHPTKDTACQENCHRPSQGKLIAYRIPLTSPSPIYMSRRITQLSPVQICDSQGWMFVMVWLFPLPPSPRFEEPVLTKQCSEAGLLEGIESWKFRSHHWIDLLIAEWEWWKL